MPDRLGTRRQDVRKHPREQRDGGEGGGTLAPPAGVTRREGHGAVLEGAEAARGAGVPARQWGRGMGGREVQGAGPGGARSRGWPSPVARSGQGSPASVLASLQTARERGASAFHGATAVVSWQVARGRGPEPRPPAGTMAWMGGVLLVGSVPGGQDAGATRAGGCRDRTQPWRGVCGPQQTPCTGPEEAGR